jgi:hypothetical protein
MKSLTACICGALLLVFMLAMLGRVVGPEVSIVSSGLLSVGLMAGLCLMFDRLRRKSWH